MSYTPPLFELPSLDEGFGVIQPGQWRLARVETVNWGTFSGYQSLPVDRRGLLITGPSGSGKSSLLDAITSVLTPPQQRKLNAAAHSEGSKGEDRTLCSYIRGAWRHETDDSGEVANTYLRPHTATWSGILLRYECGLAKQDSPGQAANKRHEPINLLALFNLKAGSNNKDGLGIMYAVVRGNQRLDTFEPYAIHGIDKNKFNRDFKEGARSYKQHSAFANDFCRLMNIRSTKTLILLHKTQAAKNFGSLDDLFRKFMLEEPETFQQADDAAEQFSALDQAHEGVVNLRNQMQHLEPLVTIVEGHEKAQEERARLQGLIENFDIFKAQLIWEHTESERLDSERELFHTSELVKQAENEYEQKKQALAQVQSSLNDSGGAVLETARLGVLQQEGRLASIAQSRKRLTRDLKAAGVSEFPQSYSDWKNLEQELHIRIQNYEKQQKENEGEKYKKYGLVTQLDEQSDALNRELRHLRSRSTNIPSELHAIRVALAEDLGISCEDLPFAGELLSVRSEQGRWQGAIERLLGQQAKTLLVAHTYMKSVSEYLETRHLGIRFDYIDVPGEVEVPACALAKDSVVKKVEVKQHRRYPEYSDWLNKTLRERFNYLCVESAADLNKHPYALTLKGQVKRKNRYTKDDRYRIDDRRRWVLGQSNDEKIEALTQEALKLQEKRMQAKEAAEALEQQAKTMQRLSDLHDSLKESSWEFYDEQSVQSDLKSAQDQYHLLMESSKDLKRLEALRNTAQKEENAADRVLRDARLKEDRAKETLRRLGEDLEHYAAILCGKPSFSADERMRLASFFKKADPHYSESKDSINDAATKAQKTLHEAWEKAGSRVQKARSDGERIIHDFKQQWPIIAADYSESFDENEAYLAIYRRIKANGLPEYEQKFLEVLHDFSQDQITGLASTIRGAFREVKDRLEPVNHSLRLSEYSPGIHLQIEAKDSRSPQVNEFLAELQEITKGTWSDEDLSSAETRYNKTANIIGRFKSREYADTAWKEACLDTRKHVSFLAKEFDSEGNVQDVHASDVGLSGGQKQKLVIFCLAAALRYQLADEDQKIPSYGTIILDEAFDKADHRFTSTAMDIFDAFGFHMVLATPLKLLQTLEQHIGAVASVSCLDSKHSSFQMVSIEEAEEEDITSREVQSHNEVDDSSSAKEHYDESIKLDLSAEITGVPGLEGSE